MHPQKQSGQRPFVFRHCRDLHSLPPAALGFEASLHGGFAVDKRPGQGEIYYGMPGCGLICVSPDLTRQEIRELPTDLKSVNFHSTKIGEFDGKTRLFLPANKDAMVAVMTLDGDLDFILPKPEFDEYAKEENDFKPTDTVLAGSRLYVADGYGANFVSTAELSTRRWISAFGGKTENAEEHGKFGTAHGMNSTPTGDSLAIADRSLSRLEIYAPEGQYIKSYAMPPGSRPCGIDYTQRGANWYAVIGSLDAPEEGRPAPIYVLDTANYEVISTIRPKEELGIERADHIHNVIWHQHDGRLFLVCQSWNPGYYFVLELVD